jgi:hypothetical protein
VGPLVLIGGGGHAVVVAEAAWLAGMTLAGFLDDNPSPVLAALPIDRPHPFQTPAYLGRLDEAGPLEGREWVVCVGDLRLRREVIGRLSRLGRHGGRAASVVHPSALVSPSARVDEGVFVGPGAVLHARCRVFPHAIVNTSAVVEHGVTVGRTRTSRPGRCWRVTCGWAVTCWWGWARGCCRG